MDDTGQLGLETTTQRNDVSLRALLDHSPDGVLLVDSVTRQILLANDAMVRMLGYSVEQLLSLRINDIHPEDSLARIAAEFEALYQTEKRLVSSIPVLRKDRSIFLADISSSRFPFRGRQCVLGLFRDVTERNGAEARRREDDARLEALFEHSPVSIWEEDFSEVKQIIDSIKEAGIEDVASHLRMHPDELVRCAAAVKVVRINETSAKFFGAPKTEISRNLPSYFTWESLLIFADELGALAQGVTRWEGDIPIRMPAGEVRELHLSLSVLPGHGASWGRVIVSFSDVTDHNRTVRALLDSEMRRALALRAARMGTWEWDLLSGRHTWSEVQEAIWGYGAGEYPGTTDGMVERLHPEDRDRFVRTREKAKASGQPYGLDFRVIQPNGSVRWVASMGQFAFDAAGEPVRVLGVAYDVTERKLAEELSSIQHNLSSALSATTELEEGLGLCLDALLAAGRLDAGGVYLLDEKTQCLELRTHKGLSAEFLRAVPRVDLRTGRQRVARAQSPLYLKPAELSDVVAEAVRKDGLRFVAILPLLHEGRIIGSMNAGSRSAEDLDPIVRGALESIAGVATQAVVRLRAEAALRETQLLRREAERIARIGAWMTNPATDYLHLTEGVCEILEAPPDYRPGLREGLKIFGRNSLTALHTLQKALEDGQPFTVQVGAASMMGRPLWTEVRGLGRLEEGGNAYVLGTFQDITDHKRAEDALRATEERYRNLVETTYDWIWEVDAHGRYTYASPRVLELLGYRPEEVLGKTPFDFMQQAEAARVRAVFGEIARKQKSFSRLENTNRRKDGRLVLFETSGVPVFSPEGTLLGYRGMDRDVTEREHLEAQLRQVQKLEAVGQLAGGVAHDFNNILAAIMMQLGLLRMDPGLRGETREAVKELELSSKRAATLTRQLLMFSRRSVLEVKALDLNETVDVLLKMLCRLIGERIDLRFEPGAGAMTVKGDAGMLEQVVVNLVVNARDAMPNGGTITIRTDHVTLKEGETGRSPESRPGSFASLSVEDTGCGMDETTLGRIFEPFFTTKEVGKGTGLGLATVHGIVGQHNGWIEVESEVARGSVFRVLLPELTSHPESPKDDDATQQALDPGHETILLVEDEPAVRKGTGRLLRQLGYQLLEASDGAEAVSIWAREKDRIDLLLTDMVLPGDFSGTDLARLFRNDRPGLKVIVASGYSREMAQRDLQAEFKLSYLPKPYDARVLSRMIRSQLDPPVAAK